jgi:hypothetical protein
MKTNLTAFTVTDYCQGMKRGEIIVNKEYQRSDRIWPTSARSFLIETILLGYPLPKLSLYQKTDLKSKKTVKEIVDGQQRSMAIREFYEDKFRLSGKLETEEVAGCIYSELPEEFQKAFIEYQVSVDLFLAATEENVREVFRRMNSFTVPLNGEEQRHAVYQGKFKWFIHRIARRFDQSLLAAGVFTQKQLLRMADTKLLAEVCHAILYSIVSTNKRNLDALYRDRDVEFTEEEQFEKYINEAIRTIVDWSEIHNTALMKPYQMYALLLAVIHVRRRIEVLDNLFESPKAKLDRDTAVPNLLVLAAVVSDGPEDAGDFEAFVEASAEKTNTRENRATRFEWMCKALTENWL